MNDITERENTINDVVLTACNEYDLYRNKGNGLVIPTIDRFVMRYAPRLKPLDRVECIRQILEYWELDSNDKV
jgi:hypothetical protein